MKLEIYLEKTDGPVDEFMLAKMIYDLCDNSFNSIDSNTVANMLLIQSQNKLRQSMNSISEARPIE